MIVHLAVDRQRQRSESDFGGQGSHLTIYRQHALATAPDVLVIQARRFEVVNWVPKKLRQ